ncbi:protein phosphatase 2C 51-like [Primulina eburnea]|uniref:protein phosphatase 2C 51-like n=1 Tax=Primulina eburnea TaxID=1245227 RepID=UPI003C6C651E
MIFDKLRKGSVAAEGGILSKKSPVDLKIGEMEFNGEGRKRMRLRRVRPVVEADSGGVMTVLSDHDAGLKKKRSEILMENESLPSSGDHETHRRAFGLTSVIGRRREMEDAAAAELGFLRRGGRRYDFFGVYDGHGGCRVAQACGEIFHKLVGNIAEEQSGGWDNKNNVINWEKVMAAGFEKMDEEVNKAGEEVATTGSTAVVAVVGDELVVVANCGDSRAVISRGGVAVQLSDDHKPNRPDELERIENSGGKVINWNGQRILGVLATSRSIGDEYLKPYVIAEPEVKIANRTALDEFLILASDGLWDVVSNELACQVARRCMNGELRAAAPNPKFSEVDDTYSRGRSRASEAAACLTELAIGRGSSDNISVIVVELKPSSSV